MITDRRTTDKLKKAAQCGGVTLVLGAGVSFSRKLPSWQALVEEMWHSHFGDKAPLPWQLSKEDEGVLELLKRNGVNEDQLSSVKWRLGASQPLAFQMALELIEEKIETVFQANHSPKFAAELRRLMYRNESEKTGDDTLSVIATILRQEQASVAPRIQRVITFNVDDLVEREVHGSDSYRREPIVWPIPRASNHPRRERSAHGLPSIPVYHLHGFLPRNPHAWHLSAPDTLIFTDAQYWASCANPLSFANKIMSNALHDSRCVFIGLSMTDINLIRWLGVRFNDICDDKRRQFELAGTAAPKDAEAVAASEKKIRRAQIGALDRHFWIRTPAAADSLMNKFFKRRGVISLKLPNWTELRNVMQHCFPAP